MSQINQPKMINSFPVGCGGASCYRINPCSMTINSGRIKALTTMAAAIASVILCDLPALAATSDWQVNEGGRMRLLALSPDGDGRIRAALQIEPKPGWITYWREPGESGIPPQITIAPDSGAILDKVGYPVPKPISIGSIQEIGYDAAVTLPLELRQAGPSKPAKLDATAFIGLCKDICIPFQASFSLPLPAAGQSDAGEEAELASAAATLPKAPSPDFSLKAHTLSADGKTLSLTMTLPESDGPAPQIYVTGPSGYVFFKRQNDKRDGRNFETDITIGKLPRNYDIHGKSWSVLAIDGGKAIETTLAFD
jgi:DsbC/DsbD-like thiol-disulfide interchange protein